MALRGAGGNTDAHRPPDAEGGSPSAMPDAEPAEHRAVNSEVEFKYKNLITRGKRIHQAALDVDNGVEIVRKLLHGRASPDDVATQMKNEVKKEHLPIHLAASTENLEVIKLLLKHRADVAGKSLEDGKYYYEAIHEAAYFDKPRAVELLLQWRANVDAENRDGLTPLHICAKMGNFKAACVLAANNADKRKTDKSNKDKPGLRALEYVLQSTSAHTEAFHFAERRMEEVLLVAKKDPEIAARLMKDARARKEERLHKSWKHGLCKEGEVSVEQFLELLDRSPPAAVDLLEVLTSTPEVARAFDFPLRRRTQRLQYERMRCQYISSTKWKKDEKDEEWQNKLLPDVSDDDHTNGVHVRVKYLCLAGTEGGPGVLYNERVLFALAETDYPEMFKVPAVQAIIDFTWSHLVRKHYTAGFFIRLCDLLAMFLAVLPEIGDPEMVARTQRICWTWCAATCLREVHIQLLQILGYWRVAGGFWAHFKRTRPCGESLALMLSAVMILVSALNAAPHPQLLCVVCLVRWMQASASVGEPAQYLWWATWDEETDQQDNVAALAQDLHDMKKMMKALQRRLDEKDAKSSARVQAWE
mmetsp:Transcript_41577/g.120022  ORF Transcript_41577/g.120022 Transcript_41577/m.120022 type:complete len:587 (+) Transcript_41577:65-1825(+)